MIEQWVVASRSTRRSFNNAILIGEQIASIQDFFLDGRLDHMACFE